MQKKKIKKAIEKSLFSFYEKGLTTTADKFRKSFFKELDRLYAKQHKLKRK